MYSVRAARAAASMLAATLWYIALFLLSTAAFDSEGAPDGVGKCIC